MPLARARNNAPSLGFWWLAHSRLFGSIEPCKALRRWVENSHCADQAFNRARETRGSERLYMFCQEQMQGVFCGNILGTTIPERGHIDAANRFSPEPIRIGRNARCSSSMSFALRYCLIVPTP